MTLAEGAMIDILSVEYLGAYRLNIKFSDGKAREVDFEPFLRAAKNPMAQKYLDVGVFKNFTVAYGDLFWNDYELAFPIADLYEGRI